MILNMLNLVHEFNLSMGIDDDYRDNNFHKIRISMKINLKSKVRELICPNF